MNIQNFIILIAVVLGAISTIVWIVPTLKKKNIDIEKIATKTETVLNAIEPVVGIAKDIPLLHGTASVVELIRQYAIVGAKTAEQLGSTGTLTTNAEKFKSAQETVYAVLAELKIEPTDNQKKLIDDFIQAAVNDLPKTNVTK